MRLLALWVHLVNGGYEDAIAVGAAQRVEIGVQAARIASIVFVGSKLQGVHKDGSQHVAGVLVRLADQGKVTFMQVAHGRHQGNTSAMPAHPVQFAAQGSQGLEDLQLRHSCVPAPGSYHLSRPRRRPRWRRGYRFATRAGSSSRTWG